MRNLTIYAFTYFTSMKQGTYNLYRKQSKKVETGNKLSKCCQFKQNRISAQGVVEVKYQLNCIGKTKLN